MTEHEGPATHHVRAALVRALTPLVFGAIVVPVGAALRALGWDPLRLRRDNPASYWQAPRE